MPILVGDGAFANGHLGICWLCGCAHSRIRVASLHRARQAPRSDAYGPPGTSSRRCRAGRCSRGAEAQRVTRREVPRDRERARHAAARPLAHAAVHRRPHRRCGARELLPRTHSRSRTAHGVRALAMAVPLASSRGRRARELRADESTARLRARHGRRARRGRAASEPRAGMAPRSRWQRRGHSYSRRRCTGLRRATPKMQKARSPAPRC